MSLYDEAMEDAKEYTTDADGFSTPITLTAKTGEIALVRGQFTKHHLNIDSEGKQVSGKNASICVSEGAILEANPDFPTRVNKEANMRFVKVSCKDSTGQTCLYQVDTCFADELLGLFTCILGDFK